MPAERPSESSPSFLKRYGLHAANTIIFFGKLSPSQQLSTKISFNNPETLSLVFISS